MKKRNYSVDVLKFVCAVLVVILHTNFKFHDAILPLTRCAVPCFLMISGFLLYTEGKGIGKERLMRNIKHIFHIILWSTLLFVALKEGKAILCGKFFLPSLSQWFNFIIFNDNIFGSHLWYLGAYLYVLVIMLLVNRFSLWKQLLWVSPLLLMGDLVLGKYSLLLLHHEYPYIYVRNFMFVGIPYFMLGVWIKKNWKRLLVVNIYIYLGGGNFVFCNICFRKNVVITFKDEYRT